MSFPHMFLQLVTSLIPFTNTNTFVTTCNVAEIKTLVGVRMHLSHMAVLFVGSVETLVAAMVGTEEGWVIVDGCGRGRGVVGRDVLGWDGGVLVLSWEYCA